MNIPRELLTVPNLLTCFRFACAPVLLVLAWQGHPAAFLSLLAAGFLSDALDGAIARLTGQTTQLGAMLDSSADVTTYVVVAISAWWLWPDIVRREALSVGIVVASCLLPAAAGLLKFGTFTSYHTWMVKLAAASVGLSLYVLFLAGPPWPFRVAAAISALAAIEELAITFVATELHYNVSSFREAMRRLSHRK